MTPDTTGTCPACHGAVEYDRFGEDIVCPHCTALLTHEHDCGSEPDYECSDWLELADS
jgi:predicted amidophosphoribosyltransferase